MYLSENKEVLSNTADLIFVGGNLFFYKAIDFFTTYRGEKPSNIAHVAGFISKFIISEALLLSGVTNTPYNQWINKHKTYEIWRNITLTEQERLGISYNVLKYKNRKYGTFKLLAHALDGLLGKIFAKECFVFRPLLKMDKYPICSWLWAYAYDNRLNYKFDYEPNVVTPDDMHDHVQNSKEWILIYKKINNKEINIS